MKKIVILTGAGISAESGLKTFRDSNGLWENHKIEDVATPYAWKSNPELVLDFYNKRRLQASKAFPNKAHLSLVELEKYFDVTIITQNVDFESPEGWGMAYMTAASLNLADSFPEKLSFGE